MGHFSNVLTLWSPLRLAEKEERYSTRSYFKKKVVLFRNDQGVGKLDRPFILCCTNIKSLKGLDEVLKDDTIRARIYKNL